MQAKVMKFVESASFIANKRCRMVSVLAVQVGASNHRELRLQIMQDLRQLAGLAASCDRWSFSMSLLLHRSSAAWIHHHHHHHHSSNLVSTTNDSEVRKNSFPTSSRACFNCPFSASSSCCFCWHRPCIPHCNLETVPCPSKFSHFAAQPV